ncbi:MAG: hypothetical protein RLZZ543_915 [Bacteroidota bacterium]|jgi:gliding motility-associated-like protein
MKLPLQKISKCFSFLAVAIIGFQAESKAQFTVDTNQTPVQYINNLVGLGVSFGNIQYQGDGQAIGFFSGASSQLGFNSGIILSTGNASAADDLSSNFASSSYFNTGLTNLPELAPFVPGCTGTTNDGSILQFDFVPQSTPVSFRYIFASEEYNEYVCSQFNDAFAFLISGPGIVGEQNLAVVPGSGDPITINTINNGTVGGSGTAANDPCVLGNAQYFNSSPPSNIVYDGYTEVMTAVADVIPCQTYTLRLLLADGCDNGFDSAVFLEANSFGAAPIAISQNTLNGDSTTFEGCAPATLVFSRQNPDPFDYIFPFTLTGTAVNGVDYAPIPPQITIPAGQTSVSLPITAIQDGIVEGMETIELNYQTICGLISTIVYITEKPAVIVTPDPAPSLCGGQGPVNVSGSATGGVAPFTYSWSGGLGTGTSISVNPLITTTYTLTATDFCGTSSSVPITVPVGITPATPTISPYTAICEGDQLDLVASTTTAGATLVWTGPNSYYAQTNTVSIPNATVVNSGVYSVFATLNGCDSPAATVNALVKPRPTIPVLGANSPVCEGSALNLTANVTPANSVVTWSGPNGFASIGTAVSIAATSMAASGLYAATAELNGCAATAGSAIPVVVNDTPNAPAIASDSPVCSGFDLHLTTPETADSYIWSGPQAWNSNVQNPVRTAMAPVNAGTYALSIVINNCPSPPSSVLVSVTDVSFIPPITSNAPVCEGSPLTFSTPSVNNAQYFWSGPNGLNSTAKDNSIPTSIEANEGLYSLYIVIGACTTATSTSNFLVNPIPLADAGLPVQLCSMQPGQLGVAPVAGYTYSWSPQEGLNFSTISNPTVQLGSIGGPVQQRLFTVTVTADGCQNQSSVLAEIIPQPVASFVAPQPACFENNAFDFEADGIFNSTNPRYIWDFGPWATPDSSSLQNPQDVHFDATGIHLVHLQIIDLGCPSNIYTAPVNVLRMPVANFESDKIETCTPSLVSFTNLSEDDDNPLSSQWLFGNGNGSDTSDPQVLYSNSGNYTVSLQVTGINGCSNTYAVPSAVVVHPSPVALFDASPVIMNIYNPEITISDLSQMATECRYSLGNGDTVYEFDKIYTYADTGNYTITQLLSNQYGCRDTSTIDVRVDLGYKVFIPSAFTPNDDGLNDRFLVYGEDVSAFSMMIFNRWGEMLYSSYDMENGWDGRTRLNNEIIEGGSYLYMIKVKDRYGLEYKYKGEVTVLR